MSLKAINDLVLCTTPLRKEAKEWIAMAQSLSHMNLVRDAIPHEGLLKVWGTGIKTLARAVVKVGLWEVREVSHTAIEHIGGKLLPLAQDRSNSANVVVVGDDILRRELLQRGYQIRIVSSRFIPLT